MHCSLHRAILEEKEEALSLRRIFPQMTFWSMRDKWWNTTHLPIIPWCNNRPGHVNSNSWWVRTMKTRITLRARRRELTRARMNMSLPMATRMTSQLVKTSSNQVRSDPALARFEQVSRQMARSRIAIPHLRANQLEPLTGELPLGVYVDLITPNCADRLGLTRLRQKWRIPRTAQFAPLAVEEWWARNRDKLILSSLITTKTTNHLYSYFVFHFTHHCLRHKPMHWLIFIISILFYISIIFTCLQFI